MRLAEKILEKVVSIKKDNAFLQYIVNRLRRNDYRGWHVSQHNRYTIDDIIIILRNIHNAAGMESFAIPPGDFNKDDVLSAEFKKYQQIVAGVNAGIGRGTLNSVKKNFFPDIDRMGFMTRKGMRNGTGKRALCGQLTSGAIQLINAENIVEKFKIFTDGVDNLFGNKISQLAEMIHISDYRGSDISIYEFMFILSDNDEELDKIELLNSYRSLGRRGQDEAKRLIQAYANPDNFGGNKTAWRDFHNWKNQAQQILSLLGHTVYFDVSENEYFRLNSGRTGIFQKPATRSPVPKRKYFDFHQIAKRNGFELHHIVPISSARNKAEAKIIDSHLNLIYIHRGKHRAIHRAIMRHGDKRVVVLAINPSEAVFSDFENNESIKTKNEKSALYSKEQRKVNSVAKYNEKLLKSIFDFEKP